MSFLLGVAILVGGVALFSSDDYFSQKSLEADQKTIKDIDGLCNDEIRKHTPARYSTGHISKSNMQNIAIARRTFCPVNAGAKMFDDGSLYYWLGKASYASMCDLSMETQTCLNTLQPRVETGQQQIPLDFETKINTLFQNLKIPRNIQ
jgi:hypothetical protein